MTLQCAPRTPWRDTTKVKCVCAISYDLLKYRVAARFFLLPSMLSCQTAGTHLSFANRMERLRHGNIDAASAGLMSDLRVAARDDDYFLRMPVSVLPRVCAALLAAGVSTAFPWEAAAGEPLVCGVPLLLPVVPWVRAFEMLGPGNPSCPANGVAVRKRGSASRATSAGGRPRSSAT